MLPQRCVSVRGYRTEVARKHTRGPDARGLCTTFAIFSRSIIPRCLLGLHAPFSQHKNELDHGYKNIPKSLLQTQCQASDACRAADCACGQKGGTRSGQQSAKQDRKSERHQSLD